ncbi:hypothetical protein P7K49_000791 [Saguinus oedipus]|uniref:C-type lectin domain-containing protein n=1 Tax=Saguinus oedipus TaxID=9490 RepID=A0ABQ9WCM6_SAGOE|nr:hypothetical protein P7K49_000791 [Saguinus oedipus]
MKDDFTEEEEVKSFDYKWFGIQEGTQCSKRGMETSRQTYDDKLTAVESDLKKLGDQTGKKAIITNSELSTFRSDILDICQQLREITEKKQYSRGTSSRMCSGLWMTQARLYKNDFQNLQQVFLQAKKDTDWLKEKVQSLQMLATNNSALAKANNDTLEDMNSQLNSFIENRTAIRFNQLEEHFQLFETDIVNIISNINYTAHHLRMLTSNLNEVRTTCTDTLTKHKDDVTSLKNTLANICLDSVSLRMQQDLMRSRLDTEVANLSVIMEEMKLGPPGPTGNKGQKGEKGELDCPALWVREAQWESVPLESVVAKALKAPRDPKTPVVPLGSPAPRASVGTQTPRGHRAEKDSLAPMALLASRDYRAPWGSLGCLDLRDCQVCLGYQACQDPRVPRPPGPSGAVVPLALQNEPTPALEDNGCPPHWKNFTDKCCYFSVEKEIFEDAKLFCEDKSSHLVFINSREEQQWIKKQMVGRATGSASQTRRIKMNGSGWMGHLQTTKVGKLDSRITGVMATGQEKTAGLIYAGQWNDFQCEDINNFICEKDRETVLSSAL